MSNRSVYCRAKSILRVLCVAFPCFALGLVGSPAFGQQESVEGKWFPPIGGTGDGYGWPLMAVDAALLSTGKVLLLEHLASSARLWNPVDGVFDDVPCSAPACRGSLHCPGHAFLTDGSHLAAGGGLPTEAVNETRIFRLSANSWEQATPMTYGRWYPTSTTLPDGRVLTLAGTEIGGSAVLTPEIYNPPNGPWTELAVTTTGILDVYPFIFVLPDGKVFCASGGFPFLTRTYTLDIQNEVWDEFPTNSNSFFSGYRGAAVMYEPGKVLKCGGGETVSNIEQRTAMIDLTEQPTPVWRTETA